MYQPNENTNPRQATISWLSVVPSFPSAKKPAKATPMIVQKYVARFQYNSISNLRMSCAIFSASTVTDPNRA